MFNRRSLLAAPALLLTTSIPARAAEEVDTALILLTDVSTSINEEQFGIQTDGIASSFEWSEFHTALDQTMLGKIAVSYVQWADIGSVKSSPWFLIKDKASAIEFGAFIRSEKRAFGGGTSVVGALGAAARLLAECPYEPIRRVVDISSDGKDKGSEPSIAALREKILSYPRTQINAITMADDEKDVTDWYRDYVIGGPGSFIIEVTSPREFPMKFRQKILTEAV